VVLKNIRFSIFSERPRLRQLCMQEKAFADWADEMKYEHSSQRPLIRFARG
jgi:hypothetical protein